MPTDKATDWQNAKSDYKAVTGAKKPRVKILAFFKTGNAGISGALEACDKLANAAAKPGNAAKLAAATAKLKSVANSYATTLNDLISKEKTASVKEATKGGHDDPREISDLENALKALRKRLTSYVAYFEFEVAQITAIENKGSMADVARASATANVKQALAAAIASAAAVKANPTPAIYDAQIGDGVKGGARRLTTALQGYSTANPADTKAKAHIAVLTPFASGPLSKVNADASKDKVLAQLQGFINLLKPIKTDSERWATGASA